MRIEHTSSYSATRSYAGRAVAARASELGFRHGGQLSRIDVDIGHRVEAGALLALLDTASLDAQREQANAEVMLAGANLVALEAESQLARQTEGRFRSLAETGHVSKQAYDEQLLALQAKNAQADVARANLLRAKAALHAVRITVQESRILAPFAGTIQARYMDEGTQVLPGQAVLRLIETGHIEAHVGIPEVLASQLSAAADHRVSWERQDFRAELKSVLPEVDPSSRTLTAVFDIPDSPIPPGSVVELKLDSTVVTSGFWLPLTALTQNERGLWAVFVINADSSVENRLVEIIHTESDRAYVRGTLNNGEQIVSTGVQRIVPGQAVRVVEGD